jgi:hypothetical protein
MKVSQLQHGVYLHIATADVEGAKEEARSLEENRTCFASSMPPPSFQ